VTVSGVLQWPAVSCGVLRFQTYHRTGGPLL